MGVFKRQQHTAALRATTGESKTSLRKLRGYAVETIVNYLEKHRGYLCLRSYFRYDKAIGAEKNRGYALNLGLYGILISVVRAEKT